MPPLVFRSMVADGAGMKPQIANDANSLGVRVAHETGGAFDITVESDLVQPGREGMSVSPSPQALPFHRIPRRLKAPVPAHLGIPSGRNDAVCWRAGEGLFADAPFAEGLQFMTQPEGSKMHGVIAPAVTTPLTAFRSALAATQPMWQSERWPWEGAAS